MSKTTTTKRKNGSIAELAKAMNISTGYVHRLLRGGMPDDLIGARHWKERQAGGDDTARELRQERIRLVRSTRERVDMDNRARAGELVLAAEVDQDMQAIGATMKAMLQRIENDVPPTIEGMSAIQIKAELRIQHDRMLDSFNGEAARRINSQRNATPNK